MPTKLNHVREPVEVENASDIPQDLAVATKRAILELIEMRDIHVDNGDFGFFADLFEELMPSPEARPKPEDQRSAELRDARVPPEHACPACGEDRMDHLVWIDDERVQCAECGRIYRPGTNNEEWRSHDDDEA